MSKGAVWVWIIWIGIIFLFVGLFPKTCGKISTNPSAVTYNCAGIKAGFIDVKNYSWCYGICIERSVEKSENKTIETDNGVKADPVINEIISSFSALLYPGIIIVIIIGLVKYLLNLRRKRTEVVYKQI